MSQEHLFGQATDEEQKDIPWSSYVRMVQLFFNEEQHKEFSAAIERLKVRYGTTNVTDTVFETVKRMTNGAAPLATSELCPDCDGTKDLCGYKDRCPKGAKHGQAE